MGAGGRSRTPRLCRMPKGSRPFQCQGGRLRRGVCFPVYGLAASAPVLAPVMFPRQRAVIESTSNTAGCLALSLGNVGPPSSMPLRILLATIGSSGRRPPRDRRSGGPSGAGATGSTVVTNEIFSGQVRGGRPRIRPARERRRRPRGSSGDPRLWNLRKGFGCIVEGAILPNIRRLYEIIERRRGPSTVVAATTLCLGARVAQDRLGVPTASIHLQPGVFRSLVDTGRLGYVDLGPGVPRSVKRLLFWCIDTLFVERRVGPGLNAFRSQLGLAPVRGIFSAYIHSPQMVLGLFPEWFAAPQPDWPANTHLTGFILHDAGGRAGARAEADEFLGAGPPPVLVTPGSAAMDRSRVLPAHGGGLPGARASGPCSSRTTPASCRAACRRESARSPTLPFSRILPTLLGGRLPRRDRHPGAGREGGRAPPRRAQRARPARQRPADRAPGPWRCSIGPGQLPAGPGRQGDRALLRSPEIRGRCREFAPRVDSAASLERACALIEELGGGGRPAERAGLARSDAHRPRTNSHSAAGPGTTRKSG